MDSYEHNQKVAAGFQKVINAVFFIIFGIIIGNGLSSSLVNGLQTVLYIIVFLCAIAAMYFGQYKTRQSKQK